MIIRAVPYSRVSTDRQAQEGVSLETQFEMARSFCEAKGWFFEGSYDGAISSDRKMISDIIGDDSSDTFVANKKP